MDAADVSRVAVLGAGVMGHGIAEVATMAGCEVELYDISDEFLKAAMEKIRWSLSKFAEKGAMTAAKADEAFARLHGTTDLAWAVRGAQVVIEAAPEDLELKRELFRRADGAAPRGALFASNTSTLPIGEVAAGVSPERVKSFVGMHFFNPPPLMPLLEVIRAAETGEQAFDLAQALGRRFGKQVVVCRKDVPGFIVNRVLGPLLNEAAWTVDRGESTVEAVDSMAVHRVGLPMGLFELADYSGIDTIYKAGVAVAARDPGNVSVAPAFKAKLDEKKLGKKSGEGFYKYAKGTWERPAISKEAGAGLDPLSVFSVGVNAAAWLIRNGVCTNDDLDKAVKLGLGFPDGILRMADSWGIDNVVGSLREKEKVHGGFYSPDPLLVEMASSGSLGRSSGKGFYEYASDSTAMEEVLLRKEPPIGWVVINRPHRLNLLTQKLVQELAASMKELEADPEVRVVVLKGEGGRSFSAGADLTSFDITSPAKVYAITRSWFESFSTAERLRKPVVAAIEGMAFGGGCELALACDFRLASSDSSVGLTETNLGLMPGAGGTQRLVRIVGMSKAKEMIFLGEKLTADDALKAGLVDRVYQKDAFEAEVRKFALELAKRPPIALWFAKQALNLASQATTDVGQLFEGMGFGMLLSTQDATEGVSALFQKREPEFKGE